MVRVVRGRWRGMAYVVAAALLLSSAGLFIKVLNLGAFQINFHRPLVAALTIALVLRLRRQPMGFCLPGTGSSGDLPPRPECAAAWREQLIGQLPNLQLTLVIGPFAQVYHLKMAAMKWRLRSRLPKPE